MQRGSSFFNLATKSYRKKVLKETIICADKPLQDYTGGLVYAFKEGYVNGILEKEINRVRDYYNYYGSLLRDRTASDEEFRSLQKESFISTLPVLQKRNAALAYIEIINTTAKSHSNLKKLFLKSNQEPSDEYCNERVFGTEKKNVSVSMRTNTLVHPFTANEIIEIKKIAENYESKVELLLKDMSRELHY